MAGVGSDGEREVVDHLPPAPRPDQLLDHLVLKLGKVSPAWTNTFPQTTAGYRKLQRLLNRYGYSVVRSSLEAALELRIEPALGNAVPVLTSLCRRKADAEQGR